MFGKVYRKINPHPKEYYSLYQYRRYDKRSESSWPHHFWVLNDNMERVGEMVCSDFSMPEFEMVD